MLSKWRSHKRKKQKRSQSIPPPNGKYMPLVAWCRSRGFSGGTGWKLARDGRLPVVHIPGINRTMVDCEAADKLFVPGQAQDGLPVPQVRRGRPKRAVATEAAREHATPPPTARTPRKRPPPPPQQAEPPMKRRGRPKKPEAQPQTQSAAGTTPIRGD